MPYLHVRVPRIKLSPRRNTQASRLSVKANVTSGRDYFHQRNKKRNKLLLVTEGFDPGVKNGLE